MFENFLIRSDSLRNDEVGGDVVGFSLAARNANYRGVYLSLHNGYFIEVDGVGYPVSAQTFEINGKPPRGFGNDLKGARHRIKVEPLVSEPLKRKARDKVLRELPVVPDII